MESFRQRIGQNYGELVPLGNSKVPTRRYREEFTAEPKTKIEASVDPGETAFGGSGISSKYWTFDGLRQQSKRFQPVKRISASLPNATLLHYLEEYEAHGKPLIIEDWHKHPNWPKDLFDIDRLLEHNGHQKWQVRNVRDCTDKEVTLAEFIKWSRDRVSSGISESEDLLYGKDAPCPTQWREWVNNGNLLPQALCPHGPTDLLRNLTETEEVESLMCYFGIGDTFTPCHKDLCASSGQNIMCYTEDGGSSFWFMTSSSDAPLAGAYFQKHIGQELDWEAHTVSVEEFSKAPFTVYIAEQKLGDLVLVPPRSCHQVVNRGGLTVKTSWSRMTVQGLEIALHHELPIYRRVCRPEQYRVKHIIYRSLLCYAKQLKAFSPYLQGGFRSSLLSHNHTDFLEAGVNDHEEIPLRRLSPKIVSDLRILIDLFDTILHEEYTPDHATLPTICPSTSTLANPDLGEPQAVSTSHMRSECLPKLSLKASSLASREDSVLGARNFACDYCGADIFQSFFECRQCSPIHYTSIDAEEKDGPKLGDGLIICSPCYAEGRTCGCKKLMYAVQCRPFTDLLRDRNEAVGFLQALSNIHARLGLKAELSEKDIENSTCLKFFQAGCQLVTLRQSSCKMYKCKCGLIGPAFEVFHCGPCRSSKCLKELLRSGLHSAEMILRYQEEGTTFHAIHLENRRGFRGNTSQLQAAERSGEVINRKDRVVFVAQRYSACRPMNPSNTCHGWYDLPAESATEDTAVNGAHHKSDQPSSVQDEEDCEVQSLGDFEAATDRIQSIRPVTPRHISPSPLTELESEISSPSTSRRVSSPIVSRRQQKRPIMEVVLTSKRLTKDKSLNPSSAQSAAIGPTNCQVEDDSLVSQDYGHSLVQAMNAAMSSERPGSSKPRVQRRRVLSSSPEQSRIHSKESSPFAEEPPPPAKKRRIAGKEDASKPKEIRVGHSATTKSSTSSKNTVKGIRSQLPGVKTLRRIQYSEEAATKSHRLDSVPITSSEPSTSSLPRRSRAAYGSSNAAAIIHDALLELKGDQSSLRAPYATEAQLRSQLDAMIAGHLDPVSRKFSGQIADLEEMLRRSNERVLEQERIISSIHAKLLETNLKLQEQDSKFRQYSAKFIRQDEKLSQREADINRLGESIRQQALEIEQLGFVKTRTEARALALEVKEKQINATLDALNHSVEDLRKRVDGKLCKDEKSAFDECGRLLGLLSKLPTLTASANAVANVSPIPAPVSQPAEPAALTNNSILNPSLVFSRVENGIQQQSPPFSPHTQQQGFNSHYARQSNWNSSLMQERHGTSFGGPGRGRGQLFGHNQPYMDPNRSGHHSFGGERCNDRDNAHQSNNRIGDGGDGTTQMRVSAPYGNHQGHQHGKHHGDRERTSSHHHRPHTERRHGEGGRQDSGRRRDEPEQRGESLRHTRERSSTGSYSRHSRMPSRHHSRSRGHLEDRELSYDSLSQKSSTTHVIRSRSQEDRDRN